MYKLRLVTIGQIGSHEGNNSKLILKYRKPCSPQGMRGEGEAGRPIGCISLTGAKPSQFNHLTSQQTRCPRVW